MSRYGEEQEQEVTFNRDIKKKHNNKNKHNAFEKAPT